MTATPSDNPPFMRGKYRKSFERAVESCVVPASDKQPAEQVATSAATCTGNGETLTKPTECAVECPPMQICDYCAHPAGKDCEPPRRQAEGLPEPKFRRVYIQAPTQTTSAGEAYAYAQGMLADEVIAYAEQVAAERVREACYGLECLLGVEAAERKTVEAELAAEKQRADLLAVRVRELEAIEARYKYMRDTANFGEGCWLFGYSPPRQWDDEIDIAIAESRRLPDARSPNEKGAAILAERDETENNNG